MSILDDQPLERSTLEPRPPGPARRSQSDMVRLGLALAAILLIVAGIFVVRRWYLPAPAPETLRPPGAESSAAREESRPAAVELPPAAQMDAYIRTLLGSLSSRPELARWLTTDDLTGHIASAIDQFSRGISPARDTRVLAPTRPFTVSRRGGRTYIAPESFERYDGLAATASSIDAAAAARAYTTIKPRLAEAYRLLGREGELDAAVEAAIVMLLEVPVVTDPIEVVPGRGNLYSYADRRLEDLRPAQKQLLRMGPDNVRAIQDQLRALAKALGINPSRLPQPR